MTPEEKAQRIIGDCPFIEAFGVLEGQIAEAIRDAYEDAAKIAEDIWDSGRQGAHGGEQANRTAAAIRSRISEGT